MLHLPQILAAWSGSDFAVTVKRELATLDPTALSLQDALVHTSVALDGAGIETILLAAEENDTALALKLGVFFSGVVAGCHCADDPTSIEAQQEYCELCLVIDKKTAASRVMLIDART